MKYIKLFETLTTYTFGNGFYQKLNNDERRNYSERYGNYKDTSIPFTNKEIKSITDYIIELKESLICLPVYSNKNNKSSIV